MGEPARVRGLVPRRLPAGALRWIQGLRHWVEDGGLGDPALQSTAGLC